MSKYSEFQEKRENLRQDVVEASNYVYQLSLLRNYDDLLEDILEDFRRLEDDLKFSEECRDFWNQKATDLNYGCTPNTYHLDTRFRLLKVIRAYDNKTHKLVEETPIENPDEKKLLELGLYGLSEGGEYNIRTKDQIEYLSQYIDFCLDKYYYYWETDAVKVVD